MNKTLDELAVDFVTEQASGEWDDKTIRADADKLVVLLRAAEQRGIEQNLNVLEKTQKEINTAMLRLASTNKSGTEKGNDLADAMNKIQRRISRALAQSKEGAV